MLAAPGQARVLLWPNGERAPGEVGALMAGAQTALASGGEAAWYNPAGMAKERRTVIVASGAVAELQHVSGQRGEGARAQAAPGFLSVVTGGSERQAEPRFSYGLFLAWPTRNRFETRLESDLVVGQEALPETLLGPQDLDALFPDGIARTETALGGGELSVLSPGLGFGLAITRWFRAGLSVRWDRVRLEERSQSFVNFSAAGEEGSGDALAGFSQTQADYEGSGARMIYTLGVQLDFTRVFTAGLTYRLPSREEHGRGRVFLARSSGLTVSSGDQELLDTQESVFVDEGSVPFQLRTPGEWRLGLGFLFDVLTVEVDWVKREGVGSYAAFPAQESTSTAGRITQLPAFTTSLRPSEGYALGLAFSAGGEGTLLLGYAHDGSGVPADDALFRKVQVSTFSGGYHFARGPFSGSMGVVYRSAEESNAAFPELGGGAAQENDVSYSAYGFQLGASFIF